MLHLQDVNILGDRLHVNQLYGASNFNMVIRFWFKWYFPDCDGSGNADILLLMDVSGNEKVQLELSNEAREIIENLNPATHRFSMITFNEEADETQIRYRFSDFSSKRDILEASHFYGPAKTSRIKTGLEAATNLFAQESPSSRKKVRNNINVNRGGGWLSPSSIGSIRPLSVCLFFDQVKIMFQSATMKQICYSG